jgi:hypothetical protein
MKTFDEYKEIAMRRFLLPGIKPEDYYYIDPTFPKRIAKLIAKEIVHLISMDKLKERLEVDRINYRKALSKRKSIFTIFSFR